jgi:hypothetical protein
MKSIRILCSIGLLLCTSIYAAEEQQPTTGFIAMLSSLFCLPPKTPSDSDLQKKIQGLKLERSMTSDAIRDNSATMARELEKIRYHVIRDEVTRFILEKFALLSDDQQHIVMNNATSLNERLFEKLTEKYNQLKQEQKAK